MGIYDRDYYRPQQQRSISSIGMPKSIIGMLILVNVVIFIVDAFTPVTARNALGQPLSRWLSDTMAVHVETLWKPWLWWQMLTSGFAHSPQNFQHIFCNMLVLFFLGRDVEWRYGRKEFLRLYLVMVVFSALVWAVVNKILGTPPMVGCYGASGAISGIVILYALNFPNRTLLLFFFIPMRAWVLGLLVVVLDILGSQGIDVFGKLGISMFGGSADPAGAPNIAYAAHLAGAAFALIYYQRRWQLSNISLPTIKSKPKLRVHDPEAEEKALSDEVDRILAKIHNQGEASLTRKERKTLESASRKLKKRRE